MVLAFVNMISIVIGLLQRFPVSSDRRRELNAENRHIQPQVVEDN